MSQKNKTAKVIIDVGERLVRVIKINGKGIIIKSGSAKISADTIGADDEAYRERLTGAVKRAAKSGKISGGKCVLVTGGPHIISRRFTWPEMPPDALENNAETEIEPFLPGEPGDFRISYKILNRETVLSNDTGNHVTRFDMLVTAISKDTASVLVSAARKAGFSVKRVDTRENAREKLLHTDSLWHAGGFDRSGSFAILDLADSLVNMSVFIAGTFYANRYFSTHIGMPGILDGGAGGHYQDDGDDTAFADNLAAEVVSIIDYVQYQERDSIIEEILLYGDEKAVPGLSESFRENMDIPLIRISDTLDGTLLSKRQRKRGVSGVAKFLDAYAAALIPAAKNGTDIDLRNRKKRVKISPRAAIAAVCVVLALSFFAGTGIYLPYRRIKELERREAELDAQKKPDISEAEILALRNELDALNQTMDEIDMFRIPERASEVIRALYGALPSGAGIYEIKAMGGIITVTGSAESLDDVSQYIDSLRDSGVFTGDITESAGNIPRNGERGRLDFEMRPIDKAYADGAVDFEITLTVAGIPEDVE